MASLPSLPSRREVIAEVRDEGRGVAAVLPIHYPRELLRATGFHPIEVWGPPGVDPGRGKTHFQAYTCPIVLNATSFVLEGGLDEVDAILVPHTCDALQGMASVLKDFVRPKSPVLTLYLPRQRRDSDRRFLVAELRRLGKKLGALSGHQPTDDELTGAIEVEATADAELGRLARERPEIALSDRDFFALLRSREYLPAESFTERARAAPRGSPPGSGAPLMISGIVPEPMAVFDHIQEMGGRVVADDLACCSRRAYVKGESADPWERMAERLLAAPPDPTRGTPIPERAEHLAERMAAVDARGLLVYDVKFCEPELFDLPQVRRHLTDRGFRFLHVEVELSDTIPQQALTRIEAFIEMLA